MKKLWSIVNRFLRGEKYLHMITMFFIIIFTIKVFEFFNTVPSFLFLSILTIVSALLWEYLGKYFENKKIDKMDILWTVVGGIIALIMFKI